MTITIAGNPVDPALLPDLRAYLKKGATVWSTILSIQGAFTIAELNALAIGNTVTLGNDTLTWTGVVYRLESRPGYSVTEIFAPGGENNGLNTYDAVTDPAISDDSTLGYAHGSLWFNVASHTLFMCENANIGSALWRAFYPAGGNATFINADGSTPLTANWDAGGFNIASRTLQSKVTTGTPPMVVSSTTMVDGFNANMLEGHTSSYFAVAGSNGDVFGPAGAITNDIAVFSNTSGKILKDGGASLSDLTYSSGKAGGQTIIGGTGASENLTLTSTSNATLGKVTTASRIESTLALGTAPITVTSTTVCPNLNASFLEGHASSYFQPAGSSGDVVGPSGATADSIAVYNSTTGKLIKDGGSTIAQIPLLAGRAGGQSITGGIAASENLTLVSTSNATKGKVTTASQIESTLITGTSPLAVASTTNVTNLSSDMVDNKHASDFVLINGLSGGQTIIGGTAASNNLTLSSTSNGTKGVIATADQISSTLTTGTAPISVTSTTVCPSLNASFLEGHAASYFAQSSGAGDVVGPTGATADSIAVYNSTTGKLIKDGGATIAQIPLLAGRVGGQTIIGGTAASNNLTLTSTSNATKGTITTGDQISSTLTTGTAPISVTSTTMCTNLNAAKLNAFADTAFAKVAGVSGGQTLIGGTAASDNLTLTSTSNATLGKVTTASPLESTLAIGTAPLTVTSTTVCPNLNASLLEGHASSYFAPSSTGVVGPASATADGIAVYNSTTGKLIKDGVTTIAQIPLLAGRAGGQTLIGGTAASENLTLTSTSNATKGTITTGDQISSTLVTGTAPISVTSTTMCTNLNAAKLNAFADTAFAKVAGVSGGQTLIGGTGVSENLTLTSTSSATKGKVTTGSQLESTLADGTAPLIVTSTTMCTNLNAAKINGFADTAFAKVAGVSGGQTLIGGTGASENLTLTSTSNATKGKITTGSQIESTIAVGTAPVTVTSTTVCPNLNASFLEGHASSYFQTAGSYGDVVGPAGATADGIAVYNSTTGKLIKDSVTTIAQIPLLAGRAGGQTLIGGTAASENLTLTSTSNATKGKITTGSQVESTLAIGTAPITVTSTTVCPNLNASFLEGNASAAFAVAAKGVTNGDSHDHIGGDGANLTAATLNFAATGMIAGRIAAGAGVGAECTISNFLDIAGTGITKGDILSRDTSAWSLIHSGNANDVLTCNGASTLPTWTAPGATFWTVVPGTPVRVSNTQFTITDTGGVYTSVLKRGTVLKWIASAVTQVAAIVSSSYATNVTTVNIIGSPLAAGFTAMKHSKTVVMTETFIVPGTMPAAATTDIAKTFFAPYDIYPLSAIVRYRTAPTTTGGSWNINDDAATIFFTTKINIAAGATVGTEVASSVSTAVTPVFTQEGSIVTLDYVSGHATTPGADAYVNLYYIPTVWVAYT